MGFFPGHSAAGWTSQGRNLLLTLGVVDQHAQPLQSGFFFLGADDPVGGRSLMARRLSSEELPRDRVAAKFFFVSRRKFGVFSLLVGIDLRAVIVTVLKSGQARGVHQAQGGKFDRTSHVDRAPDTSWSPWRKSNPVADVVYAFADAIDPAEQSAPSTDSGQVMLGRPESRL